MSRALIVLVAVLLIACGGSSGPIDLHVPYRQGATGVFHLPSGEESVSFNGGSSPMDGPAVGVSVRITNTGKGDVPIGILRVRWSDGTETERESDALGAAGKGPKPQTSTLSAGATAILGGLYDRPKGVTLKWFRYAVSGKAIYFDVQQAG